MTPLKPFLVSWSILFTTLAIAAPNPKQGNRTQPKIPAAVQSRQLSQKKFVKNRAIPAESQDELSVESVLYKAQKIATEMTEEVGYLLKSTGPWLKELEEMIRGEQLETAAPTRKRSLASKGPASAGQPVASAEASAPGRSKRATKRQLGQMSSNPGGIVDTVVALSKETWEKVHAVVADLMGQAESIGQ